MPETSSTQKPKVAELQDCRQCMQLQPDWAYTIYVGPNDKILAQIFVPNGLTTFSISQEGHETAQWSARNEIWFFNKDAPKLMAGPPTSVVIKSSRLQPSSGGLVSIVLDAVTGFAFGGAKVGHAADTFGIGTYNSDPHATWSYGGAPDPSPSTVSCDFTEASPPADCTFGLRVVTSPDVQQPFVAIQWFQVYASYPKNLPLSINPGRDGDGVLYNKGTPTGSNVFSAFSTLALQ